MGASKRLPLTLLTALFSVLLFHSTAHSATQPVDLDALPANAAESMCSTDLLNPFPVRIQNKVTNRTGGDAFTFSWPSAGPGGFTSSVAAGTTAGVGATWVWTTDQSIVGFTGNSCATDVCFAKTSGPDALGGFCSNACLADGTSVTVRKGAAGAVDLSWTGGASTFTVYRGATKIGVIAPTNTVGTTNNFAFTDNPPAGTNAFYVVRGTDCATRKACSTNADCSAPAEGTCVSRGPFGVPGRSLLASDVTVSAASLTSSLITFFSPPTTVFTISSTTNGTGVSETRTNTSPYPVTSTTAAFPPGCCPPNSDRPHQLRCGDECVDYLSDPNNCGACGNSCGEEGCCSNGNCVSLCGEGQTYCNGECVYLGSDDDNCGACDNKCGEESCCSGGSCHSLCGEGRILCGGECIDPSDDDWNCGACDNTCGEESCCTDGTCASLCKPGWSFCGEAGCADLDNDSENCGACGYKCDEGSCCSDGECATLQCNSEPGGWEVCGDQCVHTIGDDDNCGDCGHKCPEGSCCNGEGTCGSECYEGETNCDGQCTELANDNGNCGVCGRKCDDGTCCNAGACVSVCGEGRTWCDGECVDTNYDADHCGACGVKCVVGCCNAGECDYFGECPEQNPPVGPSCPNPATVTPGPLHCAEQLPPEPATCANPYPTESEPGYCPGDTGATAPAAPSYCPESLGGPPALSCPESPYAAPAVEEAPACTAPEITTIIAPGESQTICTPGGPLFKEVASSIVVCGDGIPGVEGTCGGAAPRVSSGTFSRLIPDPRPVGNAFVTPYHVSVVADLSGDGMLEPGELAFLRIYLVNAGPMPVLNARAALSAPAADLSHDGILNPVDIIVGCGTVSYGTILETPPSADCTPTTPRPASNDLVIPIIVPWNHPGDTSHSVFMTVTGTVDGAPFTQDVPLSLGISDACNHAARTRDFDGLVGLKSPMAKLVPEGDTVRFPSHSFPRNEKRLFRLRQKCGFRNLSTDEVDAPQIIALTEATRGPIDVSTLWEDRTNTQTTFFHYDQDFAFDPDDDKGDEEADPEYFPEGEESFHNDNSYWVYKLRTSSLGAGTFTMTIRIAGQKDYVTGFVLH